MLLEALRADRSDNSAGVFDNYSGAPGYHGSVITYVLNQPPLFRNHRQVVGREVGALSRHVWRMRRRWLDDPYR